MRELDRLRSREENSFAMDSASKLDTSSRKPDQDQRQSLNQSLRSSVTQPETQEMMKRLQGMKRFIRQNMQNDE